MIGKRFSFFLRALFFTALLLASVLPARAQLRLGLASEQLTYLLYAPIPLHLTLQNDSGGELVFDDSAAHPWLTFLVTRADHSLVPADRHVAGQPLKLPVGGSVILSVDLTPLYAMRETGNYKVQAVVDIGSREYLSAPIELTLAAGKRIWTETRTVEGSPRTYSLLRFAPTMQGTYLYLRVEDAAHNLVYSTTPLGEIVDLGEPAARFDARGQLHILSLADNAVYRYTRAAPDGSILSQSLYDSLPDNSPQLTASPTDGSVLVVGGRQQTDATKRERLSAVQGRLKNSPATATFAPLTPSAQSEEPPSRPPDSANSLR